MRRRWLCALGGHRVGAYDHPLLAPGGDIRCACGKYRLLIPKRLGH